MRDFVATCFGEFPTEKSLTYMVEGYQKCFDAVPADVSASNLIDLLLGEGGYPLRMASANIDVRRSGWHSDTCLFYMDGTSVLDLIDYWNLRAFGRRVVPIPKQWAEGMVQQCKDFIVRHHVPYRENKELMHETTIVRARSITTDEVREFAGTLRKAGAPPAAIPIQNWYPRIWEEWGRDKDQVERCEVIVREKKVEVPVSFGHIRWKRRFEKGPVSPV